MQILLWLLPSALVALAAMAWVGWVGRDAYGEVDRDEAVRALGRALGTESRVARRPAPGARERRARSGGVALRAPAGRVGEEPVEGDVRVVPRAERSAGSPETSGSPTEHPVHRTRRAS